MQRAVMQPSPGGTSTWVFDKPRGHTQAAVTTVTVTKSQSQSQSQCHIFLQLLGLQYGKQTQAFFGNVLGAQQLC